MANIRLSDEVETRLERLAKTTGRTKSYYITKLIEDNLDALEDAHMALYRLENPVGTLSSGDVRQELGLGDRVRQARGQRTEKQ